ncbi:Apple domain-containing protein [Plasmodiophora brassicae]
MPLWVAVAAAAALLLPLPGFVISQDVLLPGFNLLSSRRPFPFSNVPRELVHTLDNVTIDECGSTCEKANLCQTMVYVDAPIMSCRLYNLRPRHIEADALLLEDYATVGRIYEKKADVSFPANVVMFTRACNWRYGSWSRVSFTNVYDTTGPSPGNAHHEYEQCSQRCRTQTEFACRSWSVQESKRGTSIFMHCELYETSPFVGAFTQKFTSVPADDVMYGDQPCRTRMTFGINAERIVSTGLCSPTESCTPNANPNQHRRDQGATSPPYPVSMASHGDGGNPASSGDRHASLRADENRDQTDVVIPATDTSSTLRIRPFTVTHGVLIAAIVLVL